MKRDTYRDLADQVQQQRRPQRRERRKQRQLEEASWRRSSAVQSGNERKECGWAGEREEYGWSRSEKRRAKKTNVDGGVGKKIRERKEIFSWGGRV
jgi:hypothetical protein